MCACEDLLTCTAAHTQKPGKSPPSIAVVATAAGDNGRGGSGSGDGDCDGSSSSGSGDGSDNKDICNNQLKAVAATAMGMDGDYDDEGSNKCTTII